MLEMMSKAMGGQFPNAIKLTGGVMPELVLEYAHSSGFAQ